MFPIRVWVHTFDAKLLGNDEVGAKTRSDIKIATSRPRLWPQGVTENDSQWGVDWVYMMQSTAIKRQNTLGIINMAD